jgi:hypothetical protein
MTELARKFDKDPELEGGVVASSVYFGGHRIADIPIEEAGIWAAKEGHVVWIGLLEPDRELLLSVQRQFNLHDLAIEDATNIPPAPEARAIWRRAVRRRAHGPAGRGPGRLRRNAYLRRQGLHRQRPPRRLDLLHRGPPALGNLPVRLWPRARTSSSTPSSISSSTTTCRCSSRSMRRSRSSRTRCWPSR